MKIGIEGQRLFRKKKHGMDMVALELIRNLQLIDRINEYFIYIAPDEDTGCLTETPNFRIRVLDGGFYPKWEQMVLPNAAEKDGVDILHCTSNTAPIRTNIPMVVTLHDIIYLEKSFVGILKGKGTAYQRFGNIYRRYIVPKVVKKCKTLITVSEFEKNRIRDFFKIDDIKVKAVYNGVSEHFRKIEDPLELERIRIKYHLPEQYFFHLGNTDPKKNTKGVLAAFSDFRKKTGLDIPLVMLDFEKSELEKLAQEINDPDIINHIHLTGYVINTDLPAIYSMCSVFLYPSLRESFGIPILEAMACGVPVITANTSSMPEVSGDAAYFVNPFNYGEITQGIIKILNDESLRKSLEQKGIQRAAMFSWRSMAESVLKLYENLHAQKT